jgi:hypothetical protein
VSGAQRKQFGQRRRAKVALAGAGNVGAGAPSSSNLAKASMIGR